MPRVVVAREAAGASEIVLDEVERRLLGPDEARVEVAYVGVNYWEVMQRRGQVSRPETGALGSEGSGVVVEIGAGVTALRVGDEVCWRRVPGSYADEVVAPAESFHQVPPGLDLAQAAGLLSQGVTAQYLATDAWPLAAGDSAVVTAAAGGVGLLLTRLLVARGVRVIAALSDLAKAAAARGAGATAVLTYDDLVERIRALEPDGVAAGYDAVGGQVARDLLGALRVRGALVLYGAASGEEANVPSGRLGAGSFYLTRTAGRDYSRTPAEAAARAVEVLRLAAEGVLRVEVGGTWPLAEAGAALDALESRRTIGKLLLVP